MEVDAAWYMTSATIVLVSGPGINRWGKRIDSAGTGLHLCLAYFFQADENRRAGGCLIGLRWIRDDILRQRAPFPPPALEPAVQHRYLLVTAVMQQPPRPRSPHHVPGGVDNYPMLLTDAYVAECVC